MLKKVVIIFCMLLMSGCSRSAPVAATPEGKIPIVPTFSPSEVSLEFLQDGRSVPVVEEQGQWRVSLQPKPFTLLIHGNRDNVSIAALTSADLVSPLQQITGTLVAPAGAGMLFSDNDLYVQSTPLEISIANEEFFKKYYYSDEQARGSVEYLQSQLGSSPLVLTSQHTNLSVARGIPDYTVEKLNRSAIQADDSLVLVVFAGQRLEQDGQHLDWSILKWLIIKVEFTSGSVV